MAILTGPQLNQFPDNTAPDNRFALDNELVSVPLYRAYAFLGVYIKLLESHFNVTDSITDSVIRNKLRSRPFTTGDDTGILIKTVSDWRPTTEESRPAVLVNRGEIQINRLGVGDLANVDTPTGRLDYLVQVQSHHVFFAIERTQAEADRLAMEVARILLVAKPILLDQLDLQTLQLISVGEAARLEESKDHYAVPLVMAYKHNESYSIQPHVPVLKRVTPIVP